MHKLFSLSEAELLVLSDSLIEQDENLELKGATFPTWMEGQNPIVVREMIIEALYRKEEIKNNKSLWDREKETIQEKESISIFEGKLSQRIFAKDKVILDLFLKSTEPESTATTETILKTRVIDFLWFINLFTLAYYLFLELGAEEEEVFLKSLPTTEKQRYRHRFLLFILLGGLSFILLSAPTLLMGRETHRYLASWLPGLHQIKWPLNNDQLILWWLGLRLISGMSLVLTVVFLIRRLRGILKAMLIFGLWGILSYVLEHIIPIRSPVGFLKFFNLWGIYSLPESLFSTEWVAIGYYPFHQTVIPLTLCLLILFFSYKSKPAKISLKTRVHPWSYSPSFNWNIQTSFLWLLQRGALFILLGMIGFWSIQTISFTYEKPLVEELVSQYYLEFGGEMNHEKWLMIERKQKEIEKEFTDYQQLKQKLFLNNQSDDERLFYEMLHDSRFYRETWNEFYSRAQEAKTGQIGHLVDPLNAEVFLLLKSDRLRLMRMVLQSSFFSLYVLFSYSYYVDPRCYHLQKTTLHGKKDMWILMMRGILLMAALFLAAPWLERLNALSQLGNVDFSIPVTHNLSLGRVMAGQLLMQLSYFLALAGTLLLVMSHLKPLGSLFFIFSLHLVLIVVKEIPFHPMGQHYQWLNSSLWLWMVLGFNTLLFIVTSYRSYVRNFKRL